jgi:hypothetical protein
MQDPKPGFFLSKFWLCRGSNNCQGMNNCSFLFAYMFVALPKSQKGAEIRETKLPFL